MTAIRPIFAALTLAVAARADLSWDFETADVHEGNLDGIYGYVFPESGEGKTTRHVATASRVSWDGSTAARLDFTLDGTNYPAAGLGLLFPDAAEVDLRGLTSIQLRIRTDRSRTIRLALASRLDGYTAASDTGMNLGRDTTVSSGTTVWAIDPTTLAWPRWATKTPALTVENILSNSFALQFEVTCDSSLGRCTEEDGWVEVDDIVLAGVGDEWTTPATGDCSGTLLATVDAFGSGLAKQNDLGGWWYAYTDTSSDDPDAVGQSVLLDSSANPLDASAWTPTDTAASVRFHLLRDQVYSGYAAIETQLAEPEEDGSPRTADFPGLSAIRFRLRFDDDWPQALGGVTLHVRRSGSAFENGRDHQMKIPWTQGETDWCIEADSLVQPSWSEVVSAFSWNNLEAISWGVALESSDSEEVSGFQVRDIRFYGASSAIRPAAGRSVPHLVRSAGALYLELPSDWTRAGSLIASDLAGRRLAEQVVPASSRRLALPDLPRGAAILALRDGTREWRQIVAVP